MDTTLAEKKLLSDYRTGTNLNVSPRSDGPLLTWMGCVVRAFVALLQVFRQCVSFGDRTNTTLMGNASFQRLCKDCRIIDHETSTLDVDLVFIEVARLSDKPGT